MTVDQSPGGLGGADQRGRWRVPLEQCWRPRFGEDDTAGVEAVAKLSLDGVESEKDGVGDELETRRMAPAMVLGGPPGRMASATALGGLTG
ncbi:hypothetical protein OsJ_06513 [Oryza sativa Japonica Group]|jgi:hypothetical protein|uniref:DUF834 domain-containing protein n=2 Tax=Oryza TaxID=4527 RepID=A3A696_ORYSJ|nr:hypothetical protein OsJ_06513 [Oryza sativa Japonica Group]